jgi:hypothetical protein
MRVLSLTLLLSALVATGCSQAEADDQLRELEMRALSEPVAETPVEEPQPEPAPQVVVRREVVYRDAPAAPVRQPQIVTKTNIKRDAAIGAGVGAVTGAVVHDRNRWKGAAVGAVLGGAAGAVVGATIDKDTEIEY